MYLVINKLQTRNLYHIIIEKRK